MSAFISEITETVYPIKIYLLSSVSFIVEKTAEASRVRDSDYIS